MVVHNRPELTELTLRSYLNTVENNHFLVVVDNDSDNRTKSVIVHENRIDLYLPQSKNLYPGKAFNLGVEEGLKFYPEASLLHRSDNDIFYKLGWFRYCLDTFRVFPKLGEFGLLDTSERYFFGTEPKVLYEKDGYKYNRLLGHDIGGSYVFRRELWNDGLRHIEEPWDQSEKTAEDKEFTKQVEKRNYHAGQSVESLACHLGGPPSWDGPDYQYYKQAYETRVGDKTFEQFLEMNRNALKFKG